MEYHFYMIFQFFPGLFNLLVSSTFLRVGLVGQMQNVWEGSITLRYQSGHIFLIYAILLE